MLTGNEINIQVSQGSIVIEPYDPACLGPNSYDVHLGDRLIVYTEAVLDAKLPNRIHCVDIPAEGIILHPGVLYLAETEEYTESPYHIPMYEGRSSLGRLGISSHITAGFGDIGFKGRWTLEISVVQPVRIYKGMRIGQLYWHNPDGLVQQRYHGKYQNQLSITPSRLYDDKEWERE